MASSCATEQPVVSIIIPAWNKWDFTFRCLLSLVEHTSGVRYETIVVDNGSTDDTAVALRQLPGLRVHRNEVNLGFAKACNQGAALARGRYLLFLNNDTEALAGWLQPLVTAIESAADVAVVGAKLLFPDGTLQHAGVGVIYAGPLPINPVHLQYREPPSASTTPLQLNAVTAACMLIDAHVFTQLGGFDEGFRNGYEDMDLCFKVREAGYRILYMPQSVLYHHESVSTGRFAHTAHNEQLLNQRWMGRFTAFDVDRRKSRPACPTGGRTAPLTAVVVTQDSLYHVAPCLEDLADQLGPLDRIVVADAGSTDGTLDFVAGFSHEHPGVVQVVSTAPGAGRGEALRAGLDRLETPGAIVFPARIRMDRTFVDGLAQVIQEAGAVRIASVPIKGSGFCVAGQAQSLRALAEVAPEVIFQEDVLALDAARSQVAGRLRSGPPAR